MKLLTYPELANLRRLLSALATLMTEVERTSTNPEARIAAAHTLKHITSAKAAVGPIRPTRCCVMMRKVK